MSFWLLATLASLATFAAIAIVGSLAGWLVSLRVEEGGDPAARARRIFAVRVLPSLLGIFLGAGLALPSFLLFEPRGRNEMPGLALLLLASIGGLSIAAGLRRALLDFHATRRLRLLWEREGRPLSLAGAPAVAYAIRHPFPVVSVVGIVRPRLFVAEQVMERLSPPELAAVLAHEAGHLAARDNLKRIVLRLLPLMPWPGLSWRLDRAWDEAAEEAADGRAANGLELAAALLKIARLVPAGARLDLPAAALHRGGSVAHRVRLLTAAGSGARGQRRHRAWAYALAVAAAVAVAVLNAPVLAVVHGVLEHLVHLL